MTSSHVPMVRVDDTDTGAGIIDRPGVEGERTGRQPGQPGLEQAAVVGGVVAVVGTEDDKLVTAVACEKVPLAQSRRECPGHCDQESVTRVVAVAVIDRLEAVEIDESHMHGRAGTLAVAQCTLELTQERPPVGHSRQRIGERKALILEILPPQPIKQSLALDLPGDDMRKQVEQFPHTLGNPYFGTAGAAQCAVQFTVTDADRHAKIRRDTELTGRARVSPTAGHVVGITAPLLD